MLPEIPSAPRSVNLYILARDGTVVPCSDAETWLTWLLEYKRSIARHELISTINRSRIAIELAFLGWSYVEESPQCPFIIRTTIGPTPGLSAQVSECLIGNFSEYDEAVAAYRIACQEYGIRPTIGRYVREKNTVS